uniref:Uncharacterized protein n=1 Tax=Anguilla anguilla TaxID=7936 RepID=A0A0E9Y2U2_ANGAN
MVLETVIIQPKQSKGLTHTFTHNSRV